MFTSFGGGSSTFFGLVDAGGIDALDDEELALSKPNDSARAICPRKAAGSNLPSGTNWGMVIANRIRIPSVRRRCPTCARS
jgi:hypothetical protein